MSTCTGDKMYHQLDFM